MNEYLNSIQIEQWLCSRVEAIRLTRNITQQALAEEAGISLRTYRRFAKAQGSTLDTFVRILSALDLQESFLTILPDPAFSPLEQLGKKRKSRLRARPVEQVAESESGWTWGDD